MNRGYIKVWRKLEDSGIMGNAEVCQLFLYLMLKASSKPRKQLVGTAFVELLPGQVIVGRKQLATDLHSTERKIRTSIATLERMGIIDQQATNRFTLISLINWNRYQCERPADDQPDATKRPAGDQQATTNKNLRMGEEKSKGRSTLDLLATLEDQRVLVDAGGVDPVRGSEECPEEAPTPQATPPPEPALPPVPASPSPTFRKAAKAIPDCPYQKLVDLYHEALPGHAKVLVHTDKRRKSVKARWVESAQRLKALGEEVTEANMLAWWQRLFERVRGSPFLTGQVHSRDKPPFMANFDFIMQPSGFVKIIEGFYNREDEGR